MAELISKNHSHDYLPLSGGLLTGDSGFLMGDSDKFFVWRYSTTTAGGSWRLGCLGTGTGDTNYFTLQTTTAATGATESWDSAIRIGQNSKDILLGSTTASSSATTGSLVVSGGVGIAKDLYAGGSIYGTKVSGAVWNDYAEYRNQIESIEPGYCVTSLSDGKLFKTTERLQMSEGIVSDTFGFSIGETNECKTPLAVSGRVLAYYNGQLDDYSYGDAVCAGPEGKVCKMTRKEIQEYPDRIVGIVSEIPEYETWGTGNVPVDGRIWIKVK